MDVQLMSPSENKMCHDGKQRDKENGEEKGKEKQKREEEKSGDG